MLIVILPTKNLYSQNTLKIIKIIELDSSIIKTEFNKKLYYTISYNRFMISSFKSSMYDSNKGLLDYYRKKVNNDSLNISTIIKSSTFLLFNNEELKDTINIKNSLIQNQKTELLIKDNTIVKVKSRSFIKSLIIIGIVLKSFKII